MQLNACNQQVIETFIAVFAEDAEIFMDIGDEDPTLAGREQIRWRYEMFQENPQNKSTLMGRVLQGNFVFNHELITRRENSFKM